jgi:hypothetical protein
MTPQINGREGIPPNALPAVEAYRDDPLLPGVQSCPGCVALRGQVYCQLLGARKDDSETSYVAESVVRQTSEALSHPTRPDYITTSYRLEEPALSNAETTAMRLKGGIERARLPPEEGGASGLYLHYDHDNPVEMLTVCAQHRKIGQTAKLLLYIADNNN